MKRKLLDARGETLVELMAAILIGALSVAMLFGAVMASGRIDQRAASAEAKLRAELDAAENRTEIRGTGEVKLNRSDAPGIYSTVPVTFYGSSDGLVSYAGGAAP